MSEGALEDEQSCSVSHDNQANDVGRHSRALARAEAPTSPASAQPTEQAASLGALAGVGRGTSGRRDRPSTLRAAGELREAGDQSGHVFLLEAVCRTPTPQRRGDARASFRAGRRIFRLPGRGAERRPWPRTFATPPCPGATGTGTSPALSGPDLRRAAVLLGQVSGSSTGSLVTYRCPRPGRSSDGSRSSPPQAVRQRTAARPRREAAARPPGQRRIERGGLDVHRLTEADVQAVGSGGDDPLRWRPT